MAGAAVLAVFLGCETRQTKEEERARIEAKEAATATRKALAKRLEILDRDIEKLEERTRKASAKTKVKLEENTRDLRAEARRLRDRMSGWDDKADSAWRDIKREVEEGLDKTERAIKKFVDEIKN